MGDQPDPQYLLTSRAPEHLPARQWLEGQRDYWGIEAGLHQRLDVSADEDRSRVRHRNAVWVLAMFRRISVSLFMHWRAQNTKRAKATLPDFHEEMGLEHQRRAFALVVSKKSTALESSWASRASWAHAGKSTCNSVGNEYHRKITEKRPLVMGQED